MPSSHLQYSSDPMRSGDITTILGFCVLGNRIFLYFGLRILTRLPVWRRRAKKCYIHENTFSTHVIGIQHASTKRKLVSAAVGTLALSPS